MSGNLYDTLRVLDEAVAKASGVREIARIARIETLLRQYISIEWDRLARRASVAAASAVRRGHTRLTPADIKSVSTSVDAVMGRWAGRVTKRFVDDTERIYRLARLAGHRKGTGKTTASLGYTTEEFPARVREKERQEQTKKAAPELEIAFDLVDEKAVEALRRNQTFWIGEHYGRNVSKVVSDVARTTIVEAGFGQVAAGKVMASAVRGALRKVTTPTGWVGTGKQYFEMLTANAATVARVQGQLKSFADLDFDSYEWVNPSDRRTCKRCDHLNGKIFKVKDGQKQMQAEIAASKPDAVRSIHPWMTLKQITVISPEAGHVSQADSRRLALAGVALPPLHGRCRCTVDVA